MHGMDTFIRILMINEHRSRGAIDTVIKVYDEIMQVSL